MTESLAQSAQLKRNVIIPGTLQYMQADTLRGVTNRLRIAVIRDLKVPVFNFRGDVDYIDSSDGSAFLNPFASIKTFCPLKASYASILILQQRWTNP